MEKTKTNRNISLGKESIVDNTNITDYWIQALVVFLNFTYNNNEKVDSNTNIFENEPDNVVGHTLSYDISKNEPF